MKAALIPPTPELKHFGNGEFHLLLSHLLTELPGRQAYKRHYLNERRRGAYLVLDNSAHEMNAGQAADLLLEQAYGLRAQEIVVPDVLFDKEGTIEGAVSAMEEWLEGPNYLLFQDLNPSLMYVPQGYTLEEWIECLTELVRLHAYATKRKRIRHDFVVGLSKDYEMWDGGLTHLIEYLRLARDSVAQRGVKMHVHMLGWGRQLWELGKIAREYPWIRSTDSAKPFVYALKNIQLNLDAAIPPYPRRSKRYFRRALNDDQRITAQMNVRIFRALAEGQV